MQRSKKLKLYKEALLHIDRLEKILIYLKKFYPLNVDNLEKVSQDKLDAFAFRFAKLQDLLGAKIFREYLEELGFPTQDKNFLIILKELDKEGVIDIDRWAEFKSVRNSIAHDYPYEEDEKIDAINYLIENIDYLFNIVNSIKERDEA